MYFCRATFVCIVLYLYVSSGFHFNLFCTSKLQPNLCHKQDVLFKHSAALQLLCTCSLSTALVQCQAHYYI